MAKFVKIIHENNEIFLIKKFIRLFRRKIENRKKSRFSFVITGGSSQIKLYKELAKNKLIPWKKIDFFISDERFVKENSRYSNINMCKKFLLNKIKLSKIKWAAPYLLDWTFIFEFIDKYKHENRYKKGKNDNTYE